MSVQIQLRRGTAAAWTSANPTLAQAEFGYETDTGKFKVGDGSTAWASLGYYGAPPTGTAGGDLSGTYPNPSVVDDSHGHTATTVTTHSTAHAHSSLTGITATDHHAAPVAGPDADITIDAAGAAGTAGAFARSAHGHKVATYASTPPDADATAASAGTSGTAPARGDHRHHGHAQSHDHSAAGDGQSLNIAGSLALTNDETITTTGTIADYALGATIARTRWNGASAATLSGAQGGADGRIWIVDNVTAAQVLTVANEDTVNESTATRRFTGIDGQDMTLNPGASAVFNYDATANRWLCIARAAAFIAGPDANITIDAAGAAGTAGKGSRSGHGHQVVTTDAPSGANITIDAAAAAAATGAIARAAHGHRLNTSANTPSAIGTAAAGTSGHSPSRDDHVHATGAGTPSTQAFGDAAATGTGPAAAMTDHKHAMPAAAVTSSGLTVSATARILGRNSAGSGAIEELTATTTKSLLAIAQADVSGLTTADSPTFTAITLTNGQIVFPATQVASAGANTLDDYEEGTWTPTFAYVTVGSSSFAHSVQVGLYTKIGRLVQIECTCTAVATNGTGSGSLQITGLPFTSNATANSGHQVAMAMQGWTKASYTSVTGRVGASATTILFDAVGSGQAIATLAVADIPNSGTVSVRATGTYEV